MPGASNYSLLRNNFVSLKNIVFVHIKPKRILKIGMFIMVLRGYSKDASNAGKNSVAKKGRQAGSPKDGSGTLISRTRGSTTALWGLGFIGLGLEFIG